MVVSTKRLSFVVWEERFTTAKKSKPNAILIH